MAMGHSPRPNTDLPIKPSVKQLKKSCPFFFLTDVQHRQSIKQTKWINKNIKEMGK